MQELELTSGRLWRFFWAILWRSTVIMVPILFVMGFITAMIVVMTGIPNFNNSPGYVMAQGAALLLFQPLVLGWAMRAKYSDFRIVLVPPDPPAAV